MRARQPDTWLFTDERMGDPIAAVRRLPRGAGVILRHHGLPARQRRALHRRLRLVAAARGLRLIDDGAGIVSRVHDSRELRRALGQRAPLIFISSLYPTRSHPERRPLPRMRAATLARLAGRKAFALGGMDECRFRAVQPWGFVGWGGIDAWLPNRRKAIRT